jgi:hypothetical protein
MREEGSQMLQHLLVMKVTSNKSKRQKEQAKHIEAVAEVEKEAEEEAVKAAEEVVKAEVKVVEEASIQEKTEKMVKKVDTVVEEAAIVVAEAEAEPQEAVVVVISKTEKALSLKIKKLSLVLKESRNLLNTLVIPINSKARTTRNGTHMIGSQELAEAEKHLKVAMEEATGERLVIKLLANKKERKPRRESLLRTQIRRLKVLRQLKKEKRPSHKKRRKNLKSPRRKASL